MSRHIVDVLTTGVDDATSTPWLLMELLAGETLDAHIDNRGPLSWDEAARVFKQLGDAIGAAHRAGVLHLDLKALQRDAGRRSPG